VRDIEWFLQNSIEDGDCWIWQRACSTNGTPKVTIVENSIHHQWAVRRYIATLLRMEIEGKLVTNKCGNQRCVCPDHLLIVSKKRMADLIVQRTGHPHRIERNAKISATQRRKVGKLTPEIVAEIRASDATLKELSEKYGIAKSTAGDIRRFEGWKDYSSPFMGLMR